MAKSPVIIAGLTLLAWMAAAGQDGLVAVDQRDYPDSANGCGPASILNLLRFGNEGLASVERSLVGGTDGVKMRFLVDRYFRHRPSAVDAGRSRWGVHGVDCRDLLDGVNELLAEHGREALRGEYLDRREGETGAGQIERVHREIDRSLAAGVPPMLSLRSFVVKRREENDLEPAWEPAGNHIVLVVAMRGEPSATGFEVEAIDPWKAERTTLYFHREANGQTSTVLKGSEANGSWIAGHPFLQVLAPGVPTLRPANLEWHERYLVVANYLIGRF